MSLSIKNGTHPSLSPMDLISLLPEVNQIKELIDEKISISDKRKMPLLANFISQTIQKNKAFFADKKPSEAAQAIFDSYRDSFFAHLQKEKKYQHLVSRIIAQLTQDSSLLSAENINNALQTIVRDYIRHWHALEVEVAFEKAYSNRERINLRSFPDAYEKRSLELPENSFFKECFSTT